MMPKFNTIASAFTIGLLVMLTMACSGGDKATVELTVGPTLSAEAYAQGCGEVQAGIDRRLLEFDSDAEFDLEAFNAHTTSLFKRLVPPPVLADFHALLVSANTSGEMSMEELEQEIEQFNNAFRKLPEDIQAHMESYGCYEIPAGW